MKRNLITLPTGRKITKEVVARVYKLYDYLKNNAVGEVNKKSAIQIIYSLNEYFKTRQDVENAIQILRLSVDRKIGSNTNGYWMMRKNDSTDGYQYIRNQAKSKMMVAIMSGVDPNYFYTILNEIKDQCNSTPDGQMVIADTPFTNSIVRRYSDDLAKEE